MNRDEPGGVKQAPEMRYSIIVPAYNEERFLPATLQALSRAMAAVPGVGEIIVVDNNSSDDTANVAREHGARVVFEAVNQISRARNAGAAMARGPYLVFVDADTLVGPDTLRLALDALGGGAICGGGARVSMNHPKRLPHAAVAAWNFVSRHSRLAAGCFLFCRRDAFEAIGGFSLKVYASEEIWLSVALGRWGRVREQQFVILDRAVSTSGRKIDWFSPGAIAKQVLIFLVFPLAVRSKRFCGAWYTRPNDNGG